MRKLCTAVAVAATMAVIGGAPAMAKVKWKMESTYPGRLVQLGTLGKTLVKNINAISGGEITIKFYEPKTLVPPLELFDAVRAGSVDAAWSTPGYWQGKEPALALFSTVPFGPNAMEYGAWYYRGGGKEIMDKIYAKHGLKSLICGIISPEASGWFRKEIKSIDDLKGLKMRFFGLGAKVMQKLGVSTQLLAGGDIYPALERGTIDATEFSQPAIDLNLGFYQIAKHYYFPGWHQQSTLFELLMNRKKWDALTDTQRAQIEVACKANYVEGISEGESIQGEALAKLKAKGVHIHKWSPEILATLREKWEEVAKENAAKDAFFKEAWNSLQAFRKKYKTWGELGYLK